MNIYLDYIFCVLKFVGQFVVLGCNNAKILTSLGPLQFWIYSKIFRSNNV